MAKIIAWLGATAAAGTVAVMACASTATAQTTGTGSGIEEVVVTATRRAESISKVPESISAFTTDQMDTLGVKSFADLAKYTPGVDFDSDSKNVSIRGVNSTAGAGTTGIYIDDTPVQIRALGFNSNDTLPAVFDLDRVEVLRGPQGTLFGAGSEGGTIRYITPQPSLTDYSVYARSELSFTQYGAPSYEAGAAVGGPIVDGKLGFRISGWGRRDGGYVDHYDYNTGLTTNSNINSTDTYVLRAALTWSPVEALTITPSIYYQNRNDHDQNDYWVAISDPDKGRFLSGTPDKMADKDRFTLPALRADYNFGPVELISNTSFFDRHEAVNGYSGTLYNLSYFQSLLDPTQQDSNVPSYVGPVDPNYDPCPKCRGDLYPLLTPTGINLPGLPNYQAPSTITNKQRNFTQEVRLQSTDANAALTWIVGVFYSNNKQESTEEINDPELAAITQYLFGETLQQAWGEELLPNGDDYINDTIGHDRQLAGFVNATYAITDQLKIQGGVRVAKTHFDFKNYADGPQNFGFSSGTGKKDESPVTPMVGVTYQATADDLVYATYSEGYRIGGANPPFPVAACRPDLQQLGITSVPASFDSDNVDNYEVGTKDRLFDQRLSVALSGYYLKWNNIQQANYLPGCGFQYTANLGKAVSKGFDFQANWYLTDAFEVDMSLGYTDAYYSADSRSGSKPNAPIIVQKGDALPGSPWTLAVGAQYTAPVWGRDSFVRVDYEFASRDPAPAGVLYTNPNTTTYDPALGANPATNLFSVRAGTTLNNFNMSLFVDNLFNTHPQLNLNHQDSATLLFEAQTFRPRTAGLTVTYRY